MNGKILIVDDEKDILRILNSILTKEGFQVRNACEGKEAIEVFKSGNFDLVITDIRMPEMDGIEVLKKIKALDKDIEVIILTGFATMANAIETLRNGRAFDYLTKPLDNVDELIMTVNKALERRRLRKENRFLLNRLQQTNTELEQRVEARTVELEKANERLQLELTERKRAEADLRRSEDLFRTLFETSPDGIVMTDLVGNIMAINPRAVANHGYTNETEMLSALENGLELYAPHEHQRFMEDLEPLMRTGMIRGAEYQLQRKDGTLFYGELNATLVRDAKGNPRAIIGTLRDISDRKKSEEAMRRGEELLQARTIELEEANVTLKVLLQKRDDEKREFEARIVSNVQTLILPYLEKLKKSQLPENKKAYVNIIETNLNEIISPFAHGVSHKYFNLTPTEIQIADLIKQGQTTKEIAEFLNVSAKTVEFHRDNIRKKLGLKNKKINLRTHLLSFR